MRFPIILISFLLPSPLSVFFTDKPAHDEVVNHLVSKVFSASCSMLVKNTNMGLKNTNMGLTTTTNSL